MQTIYIVVNIQGYEEFEIIEKCFSRESLAENYIKVQHKKETELHLRKRKYNIIEKELF